MAGNYVLIPNPPQYYILLTPSARRARKKTSLNGPLKKAQWVRGWSGGAGGAAGVEAAAAA